MDLARRRFLELTAAASTLASVGCLDSPLGDDSPSDYASWVPPDDGAALVLHADISGLEPVMNASDGEETEFPEDEDDPVLGLLLSAMFVYVFSAGFALSGTGLQALLQVVAEGETAEEFETRVDDFVVANEAMVLLGDVDVEEIDAELTAEPETLTGTQFEQTESVHGYDVYEPVESDDSGLSGGLSSPGDRVAVGEDALVLAGDSLEAVLGADAGEEPRAVDELADFEWVLSEVGDGHLTLATVDEGGVEGSLTGSQSELPGDGEDEEPVEGIERLGTPTGLAGTFSFELDGVSARAAVVYDEMAEEGRDQVEERVGASAESASVDYGDDRFTATAEYDASLEDGSDS